MGRYGCDAPRVLVEYMLRRYKEAFGEPDLLLFQGDHVTHGLSQYLPPPGNMTYYDILLDTLKDYAGMLNDAFPNTMIVPIIGNNDNKFHNEGTTEEYRDSYYPYVYQLWFQNMTGNAALLSSQRIHDSFLSAGYYRVDVTDKITVLALDSMYWMSENDPQYQANEAEEEMLWFES